MDERKRIGSLNCFPVLQHYTIMDRNDPSCISWNMLYPDNKIAIFPTVNLEPTDMFNNTISQIISTVRGKVQWHKKTTLSENTPSSYVCPH